MRMMDQKLAVPPQAVKLEMSLEARIHQQGVSDEAFFLEMD